MKTIGVVQGSGGGLVQRSFRHFVDRWRSVYRIAGVLEEGYGLPDRMRGAGHLQSIVDGHRYPIFQSLGSGGACQVDPVGATAACSAILRDIANGCDLLVLSKFGRLESERGGLMPAFLAAAERNVPVLIYVPSKFEPIWRRFAHPLYTTLTAESAALEDWWGSVRHAAGPTTHEFMPAITD